MKLPLSYFLVSPLLLLAACASLRGAPLPSNVEALLTKHCVECHNAETAESDFRVDNLSTDFSQRENASAWIEIRNRINLGEMPPEGNPQPAGKEVAQVSQWVAAQLRQAEVAKLGSHGRVVMRRLNRHEYTHTIADLLQMKFPTGESPLSVLPPDGTAEGFDKVGAALLLDPSLMDQYYQVARRIADRAIVDGPPAYPTKTMRMEFEEIAESRAIGYLVTRLGMNPVPGGLQLVQGSTRSFGQLRYPERRDNNVAPVNGFYRFTVRAGGHRGENGEVPRIRLTQNHPDEKMRKILEVDVEAPWDQPKNYTVVIPRDALGGELSVELLNETDLYMGQRPGEDFRRRISEVGKEGKFTQTIRLTGRKIAEGWGGDRSTPDPAKLDLSKYTSVFLDYLEVEGPLYDQWPPRSHTTLLFRGDHDPSSKAEQLEYAREIFTRFLPRAYRRPIEPREVEPILTVVQSELAQGESFHEAIRVGLSVVLTSPKFLHLAEPATEPRAINQYELASRLSYFLWNSMPDQRLLDLAAAGKLNDPERLTAEVDRLIDDPKSDRFVQSFARQWLQTDRYLAFTPDQYLYRSYDESLGAAMVREPLEFFREILHEDLSALNFIDSDFLMLNERLAEHYGIADVEGEEFRRVSIPPQSPRGGLMAMAGVHLAGADGLRTKPVSRAVYVREVLFNDPPDPPPPNAGEIEPNIKGKKLTVRERLLQHQQIESCAACHRSLDPYGLALENFNVIGLWRDQQDGEDFRGSNTPPIDPSGRLPNGTDFSNFESFREALYQQKDRFRRGLAEKLLVYALGRPVEPTDELTLSNMTERMASNDDTLRSLIKSLVTSKAFHTK